ncbi:hypothetical protein [Extibacter muris]|uniref:LPXTG cell wall anchor domain-containing protein n=1 Tax=Extibacter muris TaxID=1796622 RepID=A0A4V2WSQ0_9FIRM|nr:hypothetical protein [Extibacter muris]MCU0080655.1 hypothetical protein [Extibacter muris]TDA22540.1 hypothetical protein E1963_03680 [Extibacter muris]
MVRRFRKTMCLIVTLCFILGLSFSNVAFAAEISLADLQTEWTDSNGNYPGKSLTLNGTTYFCKFVVVPSGERKHSSWWTTPDVREGFEAAKETHYDTQGGEIVTSMHGQAVVKIKSQRLPEFWDWIVFATLDEAFMYAEDGDTIILNGDYNDVSLNGHVGSELCKNGTVTVTYEVSSNFTVPKDKNITLDLNGHTITASTMNGRTAVFPQMDIQDIIADKEPGPAAMSGDVTERIGITVEAGASLNIIDTVGGGKIVSAARAENSNKDESEQEYHAIVNKGKLTIAANVTLENPSEDTTNGTSFDVYQAKGAITNIPISLQETTSTNAKAISTGSDVVFLVDDTTYTAYEDTQKKLEDFVAQLLQDKNYTDESIDTLYKLLEEKKTGLANTLLNEGNIEDLLRKALEKAEQEIAVEADKLPVKGHDYKEEWSSDETNHWHDCNDCDERADIAEHLFKWIVDKEATVAQKGSKHEECAVCHYKKAAVEIPALGGNTDNSSKPDGGSSQTGNPSKPSGGSSQTDNPSKPSGGNPQTGDNSNVTLWISLLAVSLVGLLTTLLVMKKKTYRRKWEK